VVFNKTTIKRKNKLLKNTPMKQIFTFLAVVLLTAATYAQVGIGTINPDGSAALDITSTTKGFLMPRMTNVERQAISNPAAGLQVFVTDFDGGSFMFYDGTKWGTLSFTKTIPDAPTIGTVVAGSQQATVPFTAPSSDGGSAITIYTATSSPEGRTGTLSQSGSGSITVTGLTNGIAYTFAVTATNAIGTSVGSKVSNSVLPTQQLGEFYGGGVVFYRFVAGDAGYVAGQSHGLIAAIEDQSSGIRWYNGSYTVTEATRTAMGTGSENTDDIIAVQGETETSYAAGLARAYTGGGYTDWFLPSKDELNKMYLEKSTINTTASVNSGSDFSESNFYWSSTMNNYNSAWSQVFNTGGQTGNLKTYLTHYVRAVRAF
jgi:hypothetical protein